MSHRDVETIIGKLLPDACFRRRFFAEPAAILEALRRRGCEVAAIKVQALLLQRRGIAWPEARAPYALETSLPGVFAVGDVRHQSPRNVAAAVADGALAIRSVYKYVSDLKLSAT